MMGAVKMVVLRGVGVHILRCCCANGMGCCVLKFGKRDFFLVFLDWESEGVEWETYREIVPLDVL